MGDFGMSGAKLSVEEETAQYEAQLRSKAARVIGLILASGREIWREGDSIRIYPRMTRSDPAQIGWLRTIGELRSRVLELLPRERQGAETL